MKTTKKPVLLVQHAPHEHPAILRRALESQGIRSLVIHPYLGDSYPSLSEICGVISLGGPMGANDETHHPWISTECALLARSASEGRPTAGICLGGQMLAKGLGAEVVRNPIAEVGWFEIEVNEEGRKDAITGCLDDSPLVYHWHNDTFHLPRGAVLLARSQACARQAYRVGEQAYGFQFHPEADHQLVHEWLGFSGIEDEIGEVIAKHGSSTVQDAQTQRQHAALGERSSLKIAAGIAQLFSPRSYPGVPQVFAEQVETWIAAQSLITVELLGPGGASFNVKGRMVMRFTTASGEFVIFQEENTLLWPIRLDDVKSVKMA